MRYESGGQIWAWGSARFNGQVIGKSENITLSSDELKKYNIIELSKLLRKNNRKMTRRKMQRFLKNNPDWLF